MAALIAITPSTGLFILGIRASAKEETSNKLMLVNNLRQEWEALSSSWSSVLLLVRGSGDYYTQASLENTQKYAAFEDRIEKESGYNEKNWQVVRQEENHVLEITRFFTYCMELVLSKNISSNELYLIFGPFVARQRGLIQILSGYPDSPDSLISYDRKTVWQDGLSPSVAAYNKEAVFIFAELLWAEHAKRGDTYTWRLYEHAVRYEHHQIVRKTLTSLTYKKSWSVKRSLKKALSYGTRISTAALYRSAIKNNIDAPQKWSRKNLRYEVKYIFKRRTLLKNKQYESK